MWKGEGGAVVVGFEVLSRHTGSGESKRRGTVNRRLTLLLRFCTRHLRNTNRSAICQTATFGDKMLINQVTIKLQIFLINVHLFVFVSSCFPCSCCLHFKQVSTGEDLSV